LQVASRGLGGGLKLKSEALLEEEIKDILCRALDLKEQSNHMSS